MFETINGSTGATISKSESDQGADNTREEEED